MKALTCSSCGAPKGSKSSGGFSWVCEYCGTYNLSGKRIPPEFDDSRIQLTLIDIERNINKINKHPDPTKLLERYLKNDIQDLAADFYGVLPERLERPICQTTPLFLKLIAVREVLFYFRLLFYKSHPRSYNQALISGTADKQENIGHSFIELKEYLNLLEKGNKSMPQPGYELFTTINTYFIELKNRALFRGLPHKELRQIYIETLNYFEKLSYPLFSDLFLSTASALNIRKKSSRTRCSFLNNMVSIECRARMIFLMRIGEYIKNDSSELSESIKREDINLAASKLYNRSSLNCIILNISQKNQDVLISRYTCQYWRGILYKHMGGGDESEMIKYIHRISKMTAKAGEDKKHYRVKIGDYLIASYGYDDLDNASHLVKINKKTIPVRMKFFILFIASIISFMLIAGLLL